MLPDNRSRPLHITIRLSLHAGAVVPFLYFGAQALSAPFFPNFSVLTHTASQLGSDLSLRPYILNGGAVQRLGALVMFVPSAALCMWLLRDARPDKSLEYTHET